MATSLVEFLETLAEDPAALARLKADPNAYVDTSGLDAEDKAIFLSGDPARIREAVTKEMGDKQTLVLLIVVVIIGRVG